ncbi:MAG: transcription elongation factor GreA [Candidatus Saganbacteria bacterium]|nr:transcription elongation factor GreA [Candidatus Saganbacteria bacterium]
MTKMTKDTYEKLKSKLAELKKKRPVISKAIGEAREAGDLRENSAYHAAKEEQGLNEMRIRDLERQIDSAIVVGKDEVTRNDKVRMGSTVKLIDIESEREIEYTIVPEIDADVLENKISTDSPIGGAVIGAKQGEVVEVEAPRGLVKYKIVEIK